MRAQAPRVPNPNLDRSRADVPVSDKPGADVVPPLLARLATGVPATGPTLAAALGISRAAVWKQVEALRDAGLAIATDTRGYRLAEPLQLLTAAAIESLLPASVRKRLGALETRWRLDSTSSEILRRAASLPDLSFVFAEWQDAGRGRRGRTWRSPPATNLQFSLLKRFAGGYAALAGLSLAVGVAAVQALEDCGVRGVQLKWPNDLVHGDAKLAGILVELGGEFMGPCHAVIGIGLNLRVPAVLRAALDRPCTDLATLCDGAPPARAALAAALITRLLPLLDAFDAHGFAAMADAWLCRDALAGRALRVEGARETFEGVGAGVDARGALRVRTADGTRVVDSAEVSVRPA